MAAKKKPTESAFKRAQQHAERLYQGRDYVTGIDIGYKWKDGKRTDEKNLRIHVRKKRAESALEASEIFPETIEGVPVDVYEGEYQVRRTISALEHKARHQVLRGGISVSHPTVTAGTLGIFAADVTTGRVGLLSNWHVLVGPHGAKGHDVLQPGTLDGGAAPSDAIGILDRWVLDRRGDAAFAFLNGRRDWRTAFLGLSQYPKTTRMSRLGEILTKSGRTTAITEGFVDGEGTYYVQYELRPGVFQRVGVAGFKLVPEDPDNSSNAELSSGGDSGSVWTGNDGDDAVGLHFAGETSTDPTAEHAIACNIEDVMSALGIRIAEARDMESLMLSQTDMPNAQPQTTPGDVRFTLHDLMAAYEVGRNAGAAAPNHLVSVPETAALRQDISVETIWAKFRKFIDYFVIGHMPFEANTRLKTLIPESNERLSLAPSINRYPAFAADGVSVTPPQIFDLQTMGQIVDVLIDTYRAAGWRVS